MEQNNTQQEKTQHRALNKELEQTQNTRQENKRRTEEYKRENPLKCWYSDKEIKEDFLRFGITYNKKDICGRISYFIYKTPNYIRGDSIGNIRGLNLQQFYRLWLIKKEEIYKKVGFRDDAFIPYETLYNLIREIQKRIEEENEKRDEENPTESYALFTFNDYYKEVLKEK